MRIALIIHGQIKPNTDGEREVRYVETDSDQLMSVKTYINKFGKDTYDIELALAYDRREKRKTWIGGY